MTKTVRVENADTSAYKVRVTYQSKDADGNWIDEPNAPPAELTYPTRQMEFGIHTSRRIIVEEF